MDDLDVLARDFGYRPQGKSVPMRSDASDRRNSSAIRSSSSSSSPFVEDRDGLLFNDVFGGPPKYSHTTPTTTSTKSSPANDFDYESIFKTSASGNLNNNENFSKRNSGQMSSSPSPPVYDKPVYDDDIFEGLPGLKSKSESSTMKFEENIFASMASPPKVSSRDNGDQFDDLLGNLAGNARQAPEVKDVMSSSMGGFDDLLGTLGRNEKAAEAKSGARGFRSEGGGTGGFDDLLGGFGSASSKRSSPRPRKSIETTDDPFVILGSASTPQSSTAGVFTDPLAEISKLGKSVSKKADASSVGSGGVFDDLDSLNGLGKPVPPFSTGKVGMENEGSPSSSGATISGVQTSFGTEHAEKSSFRYSDSQQKFPSDNFHESPLFDLPSVSMDSKRPFDQQASSPPYASTGSGEKNFQADVSPTSEVQAESVDDVWLTIAEVPLYTQPTKAPPPSRPPPPIPRRTSKAESGFFSSNTRKKSDDFSPSYGSRAESPERCRAEGKSPPVASQFDEFADFVSGRTQTSVDENANVHSSEEMDAAAAAMKEAMDRAEAKFRHAKEVREREYAKAARSKENLQMEEDEQAMQDTRGRDFMENQEALERERRQREKDEEEREQRRLERERARQAEIERERARQAEIERERARQAVERATREARERAAAGARERAAAEARQRAERAAVEKAQAEARERAERMAVQRAQAEARERAAAEARERANAVVREKEAKEKAEARLRAERAAVEKAAAEARERAATDARERAAAAAARVNQQKNENDLESFFSTRANSAPKARASSTDPFFDTPFQSKGGFDATTRTSFTSVPTSNIRKASSTNNIVDDLSSIFGAPSSSSGEFQEVEGETEERRRARLERHQRTQERAAKALAEKNQRELQAQREQEERHRIAESLDIEIKRWAAGKEGNLRALLSTLQYVLWPECGWQPVSLTDLITGASVKKVYRKATLCIHPDKVQQKGATLQQKYIAEKVFDLLKEAWNKFNSEELF